MRDFLKYTAASLLGLTLFAGLGMAGLFILLFAVASKDTGPQVQDKSVMVFDLSLNITDAKPRSSTGQALEEALSGDGSDAITLRTVLDSLKEAAKDKKIVGLYLYSSSEPTSGGAGFGTLREVREALEQFRASGKPIIAYNVDWGKREYYLGSVANTIVLNPIGALEFNGLRSETTFFAGALQKYGVGVQVTRVGKYKSAVEPFLLTKASPASQEQTRQLLNDLWTEFVNVVSKDRKLPAQQLQTIADSQAVLMPNEALKLRLIDKVAYPDQVVSDLKKLTGQDVENSTFRQIGIKTYAEAVDVHQQNWRSKPEIAVVYAEGEIVDGQGNSGEVGGDRLARQLRKLRLDKDVKAVVLRVNSPGGSVSASDIIQREVVLMQKTKPIVVSMGDYAASGGYWISTYADRIFAEPNTITGSIGVFGLSMNVQKLANNNGITWDVVKTARYADSETISRPKTPEELAINQRIVDQVYEQFLQKVSVSRKLPRSKVAEIAQGRVWSGIRAKQLGLVDEIGGLEKAIQAAAKQAKLGNNWHVEEYPRIRTLEERILESLAGEDSSRKVKSDPVSAELKRFKAELSIWSGMNDPLGIYARLPYNLRID
ncbi:MAG: signal peptide peptidase SppA [Scytolyngbya sp. HA4215-MV1]|nr:signal peptide peptidase SppA [Scytolyngbya sp. HA4215-MV1]